MEAITVGLFLIIGLMVGYYIRDMRNQIDDLTIKTSKPKPKPGTTLGSYRKVDEVNPQVTSPKARGKVINPKTPQRVEWDSEQQLKDENDKFRIKPR